MDDKFSYYQRHLPHYQSLNNIFFITFRLANSLPLDVIIKLKNERDSLIKNLGVTEKSPERKEKYYQNQKIYFAKFDSFLDNNVSGPKWLTEENVAKVVKESFHYRDQMDYNLIAYTIIPNHVHLVIEPLDKKIVLDNKVKVVGRRVSSPYVVTGILENLKWYTAIKCNKVLRRKGQFWQHESYDHVVRNSEELRKIVRYVLLNPVKAGLVENFEKWKWNYYNPQYL